MRVSWNHCRPRDWKTIYHSRGAAPWLIPYPCAPAGVALLAILRTSAFSATPLFNMGKNNENKSAAKPGHAKLLGFRGGIANILCSKGNADEKLARIEKLEREYWHTT